MLTFALALALFASLLACARAQVGSAATFGKTIVGASSDTFLSGRKRVSRYALAAPGAVSKLSVYLAPTATAGEQVLEGIIYADSAGKPQALIAVSEELTFKSTSAAGWYDLPFAAAVKLPAGNYWIGAITGAASNVAAFRYDNVTAARDYNANAYPGGPSSPFGSVSTDSEQASLYATYSPEEAPAAPVNTSPPTITGNPQQGQLLSEHNGSWTNSPTGFTYQWLQCDALGSGCLPISGATKQTYVPSAGDVEHTLRVQETASNEGGVGAAAGSAATAKIAPAPPPASTFGKTSIGASSDSFSANRKRVSAFALPVAGAVSKLSVYLAATGTSGQQALEGVIYSDAAGKPGSLLAVSSQLIFQSTGAPGWYDLGFPAPLDLAAGTYWIGLISGAGGGVAGFRYDTVAGSRSWNANTFTSGPSDPFGTATVDGEQMSLYASYTAAAGGGGGGGGVQHYEYVFPSKAIDVYDMDNGQKLVKTIALPAAATDIRGAAASPATHILYVSYGNDSSAGAGGTMLAYDLLGEKVLWTHAYAEGIDSMAITPDGKTIYMPVGEASSASNWNVIEAATGNITAKIEGGSGPHNTIVSLDGKHVYMGGRNASFLTEADTQSNQLIKQIGPLLSGTVRPFTINGSETFAFTTATGYLGFQVSNISSGKVLYTVPVSGPFPYTSGQAGPSSPSHGISLSPDEKEAWLIDQPNSYVHVFDISGLPSSAPKQIADIKLTRSMSGSQVGCTYDCLREGWLQHSLDGRFVYVGDSGDVIDTKTRQSVANLEPLYNSRVYLEIDWAGGVPVATSTRSGLGYVTP
ncbi:MAG: hypothetical protein ACHQHO_12005 [Solirubrobacterales bacterium]